MNAWEALHSNFSKVKLPHDVIWRRLENEEVVPSHISQVMIQLCLEVGIQEITARNADSFYARAIKLAIVTRCGPLPPKYPNAPKETTWVTYEHVRAYVGLWTDAPPLTKAAFDKKMARRLDDESLGVLAKARLPNQYRVFVSLRRKKAIGELSGNDRSRFSSNGTYKGVTRRFCLTVTSATSDPNTLARLVAEQFWAEDGNWVENRADFDVVIGEAEKIAAEL